MECEQHDRVVPSESQPKSTNPQLKIGEGDTEIIEKLLPEKIADTAFRRVRNEVQWQTMSHLGGEVPRLVAVQGELSTDGSIPVYRHPSDDSPPLLEFTPAVSVIRAEVEKALGHKVNHCLIQLYRSGRDNISEHSDKTLDIDRGSFIANVSLGAQRTMRFRSKRDAEQSGDLFPTMQRIPLPHNSLCKMGLETNALWKHFIKADKRLSSEKSAAEKDYGGQRISLTFRLISTFLTKDLLHIYGQGATSKTAHSPALITIGPSEEAQAMINAFGVENRCSDFDWEETYGAGFNVLHATSTARLFTSGDTMANHKIRLMLKEYGIKHSTTTAAWPPVYVQHEWKTYGDEEDDEDMVLGGPVSQGRQCAQDPPMKFIDNDIKRTTVEGDTAIALYLEATYGQGLDRDQQTLAKVLTRMHEACDLYKLFHAGADFNAAQFRRALEKWDTYASEEPDGFIAGPGPRPSLADYALWPVYRDVVVHISPCEWKECVDDVDQFYESIEALSKWYERMSLLQSVVELKDELDREKRAEYDARSRAAKERRSHA